MIRTTKILINTFRKLSFNKILKLCLVWLPNPIFSLFGVYATLQSFNIAKKNFPKTHSTNGVGNAFRHALWCCLIMMYCCKISSPKKAFNFCKKITDFHEELFPNEPLETKMDLHNNEIGMHLFQNMLNGIHRQFFEKQFFIDKLMEMCNNAEPLTHLNQQLGDRLVYLEE